MRSECTRTTSVDVHVLLKVSGRELHPHHLTSSKKMHLLSGWPLLKASARQPMPTLPQTFGRPGPAPPSARARPRPVKGLGFRV